LKLISKHSLLQDVFFSEKERGRIGGGAVESNVFHGFANVPPKLFLPADEVE
jgi:hypothetical protein